MTFTVLLAIIGTESQKGWLFVLYFTFYIHCFSVCICVLFIQLLLILLVSVLARTMWMYILLNKSYVTVLYLLDIFVYLKYLLIPNLFIFLSVRFTCLNPGLSDCYLLFYFDRPLSRVLCLVLLPLVSIVRFPSVYSLFQVMPGVYIYIALCSCCVVPSGCVLP